MTAALKVAYLVVRWVLMWVDLTVVTMVFLKAGD